MLNLRVIASSSKGNAYLLKGSQTKLLIECGVSYKEIQTALGFKLNIDGCIISHEHKDHSKAAKDLLEKGCTDVYTTKGTKEALRLNHYRLKEIAPKKQLSIGQFNILPFDIEHDAKEPVGFIIYDTVTDEKILFITDSYYCKYKFTGITSMIIECNYTDEKLKENVEAGEVDKELKDRVIRSHFSLENVKDLINANDGNIIGSVILIHMSDRNSEPHRMKREIQDINHVENVYVASKGMEIDICDLPF